MIKGFEQILKQFTSSQRLIVLVLLLIFTSGSILLSQYLKTDDCRPLIEENIKMHQDFARISAMLRSQALKEEKISSGPASDSSASTVVNENDSPAMIDSILVIADSHN
jgi:hypothetical protein